MIASKLPQLAVYNRHATALRWTLGTEGTGNGRMRLERIGLNVEKSKEAVGSVAQNKKTKCYALYNGHIYIILVLIAILQLYTPITIAIKPPNNQIVAAI